MKYAIIDIFDTVSKREIISRFCKASREKFFPSGKMPDEYRKGILFLEESTLPTTHISKNHIVKALTAFARCEGHNDIYEKIFSKIGKVVCFYLLSNRQAMQSEVESITLTPVPQKVNMKGVFQQTGRAVIVMSGLALVPFYFIGGAAMTIAGSKIPVQDAMINDPQLQDIINTVQKIDFTPLYEKISK